MSCEFKASLGYKARTCFKEPTIGTGVIEGYSVSKGLVLPA